MLLDRAGDVLREFLTRAVGSALDPTADLKSSALSSLNESRMLEALFAYVSLARALRIVIELESALYENASIPIVLAHRYTAISLVPGGRVLDVLARGGFTDRAGARE